MVLFFAGFEQVSKSVPLNSAARSASVRIQTDNNNMVDGSRVFNVSLSSSDPLVQLVRRVATITIMDNGNAVVHYTTLTANHFFLQIQPHHYHHHHPLHRHRHPHLLLSAHLLSLGL